MYEFAIYEVHSLLRRLPSPIDSRDPTVRYLCALFSELAYYHIPEWEIDHRERAKLIPCDAYKMLVAEGRSTNLEAILQQLELPRGFIVVDRGAVAVGIVINKILFIGFRGTQFLFDWKINFRSRLVSVNSSSLSFPQLILCTVYGKLHSGFGEEAVRISSKILHAISDSKLGDIDQVFLTGHSLGGAVAAISKIFLKIAPTSVCIFGAPRYCDLSMYSSFINNPPSQIRRPGDVVPTIPPKIFGYADHPFEFGTNGAQYIDPTPYSSISGNFLRWARFLIGRFEPHSIEIYRKELGVPAASEGASLPLMPAEKLKDPQKYSNSTTKKNTNNQDTKKGNKATPKGKDNHNSEEMGSSDGIIDYPDKIIIDGIKLDKNC